MVIEDLIVAIQSNQIKITDCADEEAQNDNLTYDEIFFSVIQGTIIEDYPDDRPYPSCLIFGNSFRGKPIHSVWAYSNKSQWAILITVYRPDPAKWINFKVRRK